MRTATPQEMFEALITLQNRERIENLLASDDKTAFLADGRQGRVVTIRLIGKNWTIRVVRERRDQMDRRVNQTSPEIKRKTIAGVLNALHGEGVR